MPINSCNATIFQRDAFLPYFPTTTIFPTFTAPSAATLSNLRGIFAH
jgi:hypothetical protein